MSSYHTLAADLPVGTEVAYVKLQTFGIGGTIRRGLKVVRVTKTRVIVEYQGNVGGGKMAPMTDRWVIGTDGTVSNREGQKSYYEPRITPANSDLVYNTEAGNTKRDAKNQIKGAAQKFLATNAFDDNDIAELEAAIAAYKAVQL